MGAGVHEDGDFVLVADVVDVCGLPALRFLFLGEEGEVEGEVGVGGLFEGDGGEEEVEVGLLGDVVAAEGEFELGVGGVRGKEEGGELGVSLHRCII